MLGIIGCLAAFLLVIYLCYKNVHILLAALLGALLCILFNGLPLMETLTTVYLTKMAGFFQGYFLIFLFGAMQAHIYVQSGAALKIAETIMKRCMPVNASIGKKQTLAILVVTLMGTILAFGGILTTIVVILLYPIALAVFEQADIPKKFILGVLANGTFTFALTMPGSPQVTNIVAMNFLGTSSAAALVPGLVGAAVEIVVMLIIMNRMINRARAAGEHFAYDSKDDRYDPEKKKPCMIAALAPLVLLFVMFNLLHIAIEICLAVSVVAALVLFFPFLREEGVLKVANQGAVNSLAPICTVGAVVGFAGVVSSTSAFQSIVDAVLSMNIPPMLLMIVCTALLCALTGGSATGLTVCLPMIAPYVVNTLGIAPSVVHRVCTFAATTIDTLPYSGAILMFLPISHMKLKEVYPATFVTTVIATTAGTIAVTLMCWLFPALA